MTREASERRVAIHEAGHAAMALILGHRLTKVTIKRQRVGGYDARGHARVYPNSPSADILSAVAGAAAEQIVFRKGYNVAGPDLKYAKALVNGHGVRVFCTLSASLLRAHWGGVIGIADALMERKTLNSAEAWNAFCNGLKTIPRRKRKK